LTEDLLRLIGAAVLGSLCALLLRRGNPELAFLTGCATVLFLLAELVSRILAIREEASFLLSQAPFASELGNALFRIASASIVSRLGAEAARDAGQNAVGYSLELLGTAAALLLALPLLRRVMEAVSACFL